MNVIRYKRIKSTSDKAKILASRGAAEWTVVVSEVQTGGRGREGKRWESREGGLWFSVILRPRIPPVKLSLLQFLVSNATRRAIIENTGVQVWTKWPNDLVLDTGKLAGILVESKVKGDSVLSVVVGIGINVNQAENELPPGATSVYTTSHHIHSLERLMNRIIDNMKSDYERLDTPIVLVEEWWAGCIHPSKRVEVQTASGVVRGISTGVDLDGSLIVQTEQGVVRVIEGTLRAWKDLAGSQGRDK